MGFVGDDRDAAEVRLCAVGGLAVVVQHAREQHLVLHEEPYLLDRGDNHSLRWLLLSFEARLVLLGIVHQRRQVADALGAKDLFDAVAAQKRLNCVAHLLVQLDAVDQDQDRVVVRAARVHRIEQLIRLSAMKTSRTGC